MNPHYRWRSETGHERQEETEVSQTHRVLDTFRNFMPLMPLMPRRARKAHNFGSPGTCKSLDTFRNFMPLMPLMPHREQWGTLDRNFSRRDFLRKVTILSALTSPLVPGAI